MDRSRQQVICLTQCVSHDMEVENNEHFLCHHSEEVAIAFGLISAPHETSIQVIENLHVCYSCHTTPKDILRILGQEIVLKDAIASIPLTTTFIIGEIR